MGMAASQARYLALVAQQSNLEYQGQQINQERSILSQQVSELYNSLLAMNVPTPPSTQDYTTVEYSGKIGATSYTFDASTIKPGNNGAYIVTVEQDSYGDSLQKNASIAKVDQTNGGTMKVIAVAATYEKETTTTTENYVAGDENASVWMEKHTLGEDDDPTEFYTCDSNGVYKPCSAETSAGTDVYKKSTGSKPSQDATPVKQETITNKVGDAVVVTEEILNSLWVDEGDGKLKKASSEHIDTTSSPWRLKTDSNIKYYKQSSSGVPMGVAGSVDNKSINGHALFELSAANISEEQRAGYEAAITNSGLTKPDGTAYQPSDFYIYFDDKGSANFVLKSDMTDGNDNATTYAYTANGSFSKPTTYDDCLLTFDPASGRITEVSFPNYAVVEDEAGNKVYDYTKIESYTTMAVKASTVTDEVAYDEAFAKYEYAQYEYDKEQQEINAKTEVIQQQDRNLELRLQRLDTQRTQITTELEAIEKVLNDNIESSYKTFSG